MIGTVCLYEIITAQIDMTVAIDSPSASAYDDWQNNVDDPGFTDLPIHYDLYFFDVQNYKEIISGGRPVVTEVGPYSFDEKYVNFDISWADGGNQVTYTQQKYYVFNASRTGPGLTLQDSLTLPYAATITFNGLFATLASLSDAVETKLQQIIEYLMVSKIQMAQAELSKEHPSCSPCGTTPSNHSPECIAMSDVCAKFDRIAAALVAMTDTIPVRQTAFKYLTCKYCVSPDPFLRTTPFYQTDPVTAYFGTANDSLLYGVEQLLLHAGAALNKTELIDFANKKWSVALPGAASNYSTVADARRRKTGSTYLTGLYDSKQVARYTSLCQGGNVQWICKSAMSTTQSAAFIKGVNFPACPVFQAKWTPEEITANGYGLAFSSDFANRANGSNGVSYGRPVTDPKIQVYISDIYRSAYLLHTKDVYDWHKVKLRRYGIQQKDFCNTSVNTDPNHVGYNNFFTPTGLENLTQATGGPSFASKPHFLDSDPVLPSAIKGMRPNKDTHDTYLDVEPSTGLLARAFKRLQLNFWLSNTTYTGADEFIPALPASEPDTPITLGGIWTDICDQLAGSALNGADGQLYATFCTTEENAYLSCLGIDSNWNFTSKIPYTQGLYMPLAWAQESIVMDRSTADILKDSVMAGYALADTGSMVGLGVALAATLGVSLILVFSYCTARHLRHSKAKGGAQGLDGGVSALGDLEHSILWGEGLADSDRDASLIRVRSDDPDYNGVVI